MALSATKKIRQHISIHSLRMEGDVRDTLVVRSVIAFQSTPSVWRETDRHSARLSPAKDFNPLPPYGGRPGTDDSAARLYEFQSTPSVWRETPDAPPAELQAINFNPLPPYGGRQTESAIVDMRIPFQSTPSVWRETGAAAELQRCSEPFQSTPSVWRETFLR